MCVPGVPAVPVFRAAAVGCAVVLVLLAAATPCAAARLTVAVTDAAGVPVPARVRIRDATGHFLPTGPDPVLLSHDGGSWMGGYFYADGPATVEAPAGSTEILVSKGFEWRPASVTVPVSRDTTIAVRLERVFDLAADGWSAGDTHVHTNHLPSDYTVTPAQMHAIARAEGLRLTWLLDNEHEFTGGPHAVSTPEATLYFTTEWRNQVYGHAALLGLKQMIGTGCCAPPAPAVPLLSEVREGWAPDADEAMVLSHPATDCAFYDDGGWPAWGRGRELPVLAASGDLDAVDIASYSNRGDVRLEDWAALLGCGFHVPPSAGTDAVTNAWRGRPPGGYRVFARIPYGPVSDPALWVESLKIGRVFVSNGPLIPEFTVNGTEAGESVDLAGPSQVTIRLRIRSVFPVSTARVLMNGVTALGFDIQWNPSGTDWETTATLPVYGSCWLAANTDGVTDLRCASSDRLIAQTGAVYVNVGPHAVGRTQDAGRFCDWIDSLGTFVEMRDHWQSPEEHARVLARLSDALAFYESFFTIAPSTFDLVPDDTLDAGESLRWRGAFDPEPGDRITYELSVAQGPDFAGAFQAVTADTLFPAAQLPLPPWRAYWWRVQAVDRAGNRTASTPSSLPFFYRGSAAGTGEGPGGRGGGAADGNPLPGTPTVRLQAAPNPSSGPVRISLRLAGGAAVPIPPRTRVEIVDLRGGRVRLLDSGPAGKGSGGGGGLSWDGTDAVGRPVPSGMYWIVAVAAPSGRAPQTLSSPVLLVR